MKSVEIMTELRDLRSRGIIAGGPRGTQHFLYLLADYVLVARLKQNEPLVDAGDFRAWLRELGDAIREMEDAVGPRPHGATVHNFEAQAARQDARCPRCNHAHQGAVACGADLGGGRTCRCELPVPA